MRKNKKTHNTHEMRKNNKTHIHIHWTTLLLCFVYSLSNYFLCKIYDDEADFPKQEQQKTVGGMCMEGGSTPTIKDDILNLTMPPANTWASQVDHTSSERPFHHYEDGDNSPFPTLTGSHVREHVPFISSLTKHSVLFCFVFKVLMSLIFWMGTTEMDWLV